MIKINSRNIFLALFLVTFMVYLRTLTPTVWWEDSGELTAAVHTLGIAHFSGYPLYTLIGKVFTLIPIKSVAYRLNLMSALFAGLASGFIFLVVEKITKKRTAGVLSALAFAFSYTFWSQAVIAEVYTLHIFLLTLCLYLLIHWAHEKDAAKKNRLLYAFAFCYGLSFSNHLTSFLFIPGFGFYILANSTNEFEKWRNDIKGNIRANIKKILVLALVFVIGLLPYLYLPIRSSMEPQLDWGNPETLDSFIAHVTGRYFVTQYFSEFSFAKLGAYTYFALVALYTQYPILLGLAIVGIYALYSKRREFFLLLLIALADVIYTLNYDDCVAVLYLPFYMIVGILIGCGADFLIDYLCSLMSSYKFNQRVMKYALVFAFLCLLVATYIVYPKEVAEENLIILEDMGHYKPLLYLKVYPQQLDRHDYTLVEDYVNYMFGALEPDSIIITRFDEDKNPLLYYQFVEGMRPDVKIVHRDLLLMPWYVKQLRRNYPELNLSGDYPLMKASNIDKFINDNKGMFPIYTTKFKPVLVPIYHTEYNNNTFPLIRLN